MIPGDILSAFPHRQFHTLPGLLDSWAALPKSYPNALRAMQGGSLYHFYDGLWYDPAERRTHDLSCERQTRYRLSQPDTVNSVGLMICVLCVEWDVMNICHHYCFHSICLGHVKPLEVVGMKIMFKQTRKVMELRIFLNFLFESHGKIGNK